MNGFGTRKFFCSPTEQPTTPTGVSLYARFALAGALCCGITHGALTPVDVIKTRMQLDPTIYNSGLINAFKLIVKSEGPATLLTGLGPTFAGYFMQGAFKFGGYEYFKHLIVGTVGAEVAQSNRTSIYLLSAATAEFIADIALCPLEATRIRLVADPKFATNLFTASKRIFAEDGLLRGFYSGFTPILFKQIPYTMTKFVVFEQVSEQILAFSSTPKGEMTSAALTSVNLYSGLIAGICAAIISQPADTLLSKINKAKGSGSITLRLLGLARELGVKGLFLGLGARILMVGTLTAGQFAIYGDIKRMLGASTGTEIPKPSSK